MREALAIECRRRIDADKTVAVLDQLVAERGTTPAFIRCDNGPELTANALRDCWRSRRPGAHTSSPARRGRTRTWRASAPGSRDELFAVELFSCLAEAPVLVENWRQDYNEHGPHSALGMMAPAVFARGWREAQLAAASASADLRDRYTVAPFDVGGILTLRVPTMHQRSQRMDR
jgi:putative transposase